MANSIRGSVPLHAALLATLAFSTLACNGPGGEGQAIAVEDTLTRTARLERIVGVLAADSLEGRLTGSPGYAEAADFVAMEMESYGLKPAFAEGTFFQTVPLIRIRGAGGRARMVLRGSEMPPEAEVLDTVADVNVGGILWGSNPELADEVVVVSAHLDHIGRRPPRPGTPAEAEGDSIYNGADDDASGVAGVLEVARSMAQDGPGERTVLFLAFTGEEMGILGSRWYVRHPVFPLDQTVADLNVEMLGRPGPAYQGAGVGWITGFERSTLGPMLVEAGLAVKPDPFPDRGLFFGSDNIAFAMEGVPAHTLSSSDLHEDYHTPDDEVDRIDFGSMTKVVETLIDAVRVLAHGETPHWVEGGRPEPRGGGE